MWLPPSNTSMARYLVRIVLLRLFGGVLFTAFLVAYQQWLPLLGDDGITPVNSFLDRVDPARPEEGYSVLQFALDFVGHTPTASSHSLRLEVFKRIPTYLWFVPRNLVDVAAITGALLGLILSAAVVITGACAAPCMFFMWVTYLSLVSVGQDWYSFGWESQLCETAFLITFACPFSWTRLPRHQDLPVVTTYLLRWLMFRVMLGAGLIKLRGDECWRDFSCTTYHYLTQPIPNPIAPYLHVLPEWFHFMEVVVNHFVECIAPFFIFLPQPSAAIGAAIQILFQLVIIASGNFSFLNWLTIVPAIAGFDDTHVAWLFSQTNQARAKRADQDRPSFAASRVIFRVHFIVRAALQALLLAFIGYLSVPVVLNMLSPRQAMNTNFDWLRLVNTHGNFGSITRVRNEVIIEGLSSNGTWLAYEFKCKPGGLDRRPCFITPYHYRIDWLMWFAAFSDPRKTGWLLHLAWMLMEAEHSSSAADTVTTLFSVVPFEHPNQRTSSSSQNPLLRGPHRLRMSLFEYDFTIRGGSASQRREKKRHEEVGIWWQRTKLKRQYMGELTQRELEHVRGFYKPQGKFR